MKDYSFDSVIIGGTLEGCLMALIQAGRGKRTIVIESSGSLGGLATQGLCVLFEKMEAVDDELRAILREIFPDTVGGNSVDSFIFDDQHLKVRLMEALVKSDVEVLFHVNFSRFLFSEDSEIIGVEVDGKVGLFDIYGKMFFDASDTQVTAQGTLDERLLVSAAMKLNVVDLQGFKSAMQVVNECGRGYWGTLHHEHSQTLAGIRCDTEDITVFADVELGHVILFDCLTAQPPTGDIVGVSKVQLVVRSACQNLLESLKRKVPALDAAKIIHVGPRLNLYRSCAVRVNSHIGKNVASSCAGLTAYSTKSVIERAWDIMSRGIE